MEELDISHLTEKLMHGKGESSAPALTPKEKYDTWEKIKILSTLLLILHGFVLHALLNFSLSNELWEIMDLYCCFRFHKDCFFNMGDDVA